MKSFSAECNKDQHNMQEPHGNESSPHPRAPGELRGHFEAIRQLHLEDPPIVLGSLTPALCFTGRPAQSRSATNIRGL